MCPLTFQRSFNPASRMWGCRSSTITCAQWRCFASLSLCLNMSHCVQHTGHPRCANNHASKQALPLHIGLAKASTMLARFAIMNCISWSITISLLIKNTLGMVNIPSWIMRRSCMTCMFILQCSLLALWLPGTCASTLMGYYSLHLGSRPQSLNRLPSNGSSSDLAMSVRKPKRRSILMDTNIQM